MSARDELGGLKKASKKLRHGSSINWGHKLVKNKQYQISSSKTINIRYKTKSISTHIFYEIKLKAIKNETKAINHISMDNILEYGDKPKPGMI